MRLIDADALKEKAFFHEIDNVSYVEEEDVDKAPTIEPKKGYWIATHERTPFSHPYSITYVCSECGNKVYTLMGFPQTTAYCWKCGAEMRRTVDENGSL